MLYRLKRLDRHRKSSKTLKHNPNRLKFRLSRVPLFWIRSNVFATGACSVIANTTDPDKAQKRSCTLPVNSSALRRVDRVLANTFAGLCFQSQPCALHYDFCDTAPKRLMS